LDDLNTSSRTQFVAALGGIFEHSPWVAEAIVDQRPFTTLADLHGRMKAAVRGTDDGRKLILLNAHPDLAGKAARAGIMTAESKYEQGSAGLDRLSEAEFAQFNALNSAYTDKFGFPFIICVRRHTKESIFRQFETRLNNNAHDEREVALSEIFCITALRLDQFVRAPDKLNVHGYLDVHVIDMQRGMPAAGLAVELRADDERLIVNATTNAIGQTDCPLVEGRPIPIGLYELRFALGNYFARNGVSLTVPPFLDVVPIRFSIAEPEGRYHIPLRVTPWSYTVYRGV
jgi:2-oxo-4-hydroxy-4-carboxy-5-ureidoimidazoline decarboxylase